MKTLKELFEAYTRCGVALFMKDHKEDEPCERCTRELKKQDKILLQAETLITNKVLEEVKKEVEKLEGTPLPDTYSEAPNIICKEDVSTLLENLKVK